VNAPLYKTVRDAIRYGFAVGKVRVLETRVFSGGTYERLVDAPTFAEQKRILSDTVYGRHLESALTADDVEAGLEAALDEFYGFLDEANLPAPVVRFLRLRYDYANLRAVLKARALGAPLDGMIVDLGTVPAETITGPAERLPAFLAAVATELAGDEGRGASVDEIDAVVERAAFADLASTALESKSPSLVDLSRLMIDVANARTAIRARRRERPASELAGLFFKGGSIKRDKIEKAYMAPFREFVDAVSAMPAFRGIDAELLAELVSLDVVLDNLISHFLRRARAVQFGPEPVIAYVMAREAEVTAVRTLLIGRLAGLDRDALRSRLRELYV
jgi:V/A-type H+-transporting ATPase subunit C